MRTNEAGGDCVSVVPVGRPSGIFARIFVVNAALDATIAGLLLFSPIKISYPVTRSQAILIVAALIATLLVNAPLLRLALAPLKRMAQEMDKVDLLDPGGRLPVVSNDEVGRAVATFNRMLERLERERRESVRRAISAHEDERAAIARDLHDEIGQMLTTLLLQLDATTQALPVAGRDELDAARGSVRLALDELRRVSSRLRPAALEQLGLVSALTELTRTFARTSRVRVRRRFSGSLPELQPETELAIYRIVQESLTNIARHAQAANVTVSLAADAGGIVLRIVDDGRGFAEGRVEHGGLRGMRERAVLIGATLLVQRGSPSGVEVRLELPPVPSLPVGAAAP